MHGLIEYYLKGNGMIRN